MKTNTTSLKEIIGRVKQHPLMRKLSEDTITDYAIEFHQVLGLAETFEEKLAVLDVKDYRAVLPEDFYEVIQIRTFLGKDKNPVYFRSMTDHFYQSENKKHAVPYTYKIQNRVIYFSPMKTGKVEVAYRAVEMDDCGMLLIPDNAKYKRALESYIKLKRLTELFETGQIRGDVLANAQQEYAFNVGAAANDIKMPTFDEIESIGNELNSMLPRRYSHNRGYANAGSKEFFNKG